MTNSNYSPPPICEQHVPNNSVKSVEYSSPFHLLVKHKRYVSDWADPIVRIDVSPHGGVKEIDLSDYYLPENLNEGGPFPEPVALIQFPHWMDTIKAGINQVLFNHNANQSPFVWVINKTNHMVRFASWCVINGVYQFKEISQRDIDCFVNGLLPSGWCKALDVDRRLRLLLEQARRDPCLLEKVLASSNGPKCRPIRINHYELSKVLGIPLRTKELPGWVYEELATLTGRKTDVGASVSDKPLTPSSLKIILESVNLLSALPEGFDQIPFVPFHKPKTLSGKLSRIKEGRTENLTLENAVTMLKTAVQCIYELAPAVIEMGNEIRNRASSYVFDEGRRKSGFNAYLNHIVKEMYPKIRDEHSLPIEELNAYVTSSADKPSFIDLIKMIETAAVVIVGVNHARRKNEIIGSRKRPYGLYAGCVQASEGDYKFNKLDIYIEKTLRDWVKMNCNKLVLDTVTALEQIRDFSTPLSLIPFSRSGRQRNQKLFVIGHLHFPDSSGSENWSEYNYINHSDRFFELSGLPKIDFRTHQFRRFFALIYYYRYDNAVLYALSQHMWHFNVDRTRIYVTDPNMREEAEKIQFLYKRAAEENQGMNLMLDNVQDEYALEKIKEIIEGEPTGGGMTKHIRRLYVLMLKNAQFDDNNIVSELGMRLKQRGYFPSTQKHGVCWVGNSKTSNLGKCYEQGQINRDRAYVSLCSKCPHHFNNTNYIQNLISDLETMRLREGDKQLSLAERKALKNEADNLSELIELEKRIHSKNSILMQDAMERFNGGVNSQEIGK